MRILLAAEEAAGTQVLRMLASGPDELVGVLTSGAGGGLASVAAVAEKLGIPVFPAETIADHVAPDQFGPVDLFLNVHSLYKIHPSVLALPAIGAFNLHPGPLPHYAGLNAPSWAVNNGETAFAVTLHWIAEGIDTGAVAYSADFPIGDRDTGLSISARCVREGIPLIKELLDQARCDPAGIPRHAQSAEGRRVYRRRDIPNDGRIDWSAPAEEISRLVRACDFYPLPSPWGAAWTVYGDTRVEVQKVRQDTVEPKLRPGTIVEAADGAPRVAAGSAAIILERLLIDGRASAPDTRQFVPGRQFV